MKTISLLVFSLIVFAMSAQDYNYLQNGIAPQFTNARDYERVSSPPSRKHDSSKSAAIPLKRLLNDTINQRDSNGKQGHWIYYGRDRPESGIPANGKVEEGRYVNDRREGLWVKYNADGTPRLKGYYENNRPRSNCTFSRHGIREEGTFSKNQYVDSLKRFHKNGKLEYEAFYNENGKEEGRVNYYYPNGHLEYTYIAKNGIPTGQATRYYKNGDIKELIEFAEDGSVIKTELFELVTTDASEFISTEKAPLPVDPIKTKGIKWNPEGYNKVYNEDDEVWQDGIFKEGLLWEGKVYVYDRDGILLRVKVFKNGVYHSDGQL